MRGFLIEIELRGAGHLVEGNRLDNNLSKGIYAFGDHSMVRRNRVFDTDGYPGSTASHGIHTSADVIDNTVAGVFVIAPDANAVGISFAGNGSVARNNRVRGLQPSGVREAIGLWAYSSNDITLTVDRNQVTVPAGTTGWGIIGDSDPQTVCTNNVVFGFDPGYAIITCLNAGGNTSL